MPPDTTPKSAPHTFFKTQLILPTICLPTTIFEYYAWKKSFWFITSKLRGKDIIQYSFFLKRIELNHLKQIRFESQILYTYSIKKIRCRSHSELF